MVLQPSVQGDVEENLCPAARETPSLVSVGTVVDQSRTPNLPLTTLIRGPAEGEDLGEGEGEGEDTQGPEAEVVWLEVIDQEKAKGSRQEAVNDARGCYLFVNLCPWNNQKLPRATCLHQTVWRYRIVTSLARSTMNGLSG
jgi:hypothetical protein